MAGGRTHRIAEAAFARPLETTTMLVVHITVVEHEEAVIIIIIIMKNRSINAFRFIIMRPCLFTRVCFLFLLPQLSFFFHRR